MGGGWVVDGPGGALIAAIAPDVRVIKSFSDPQANQLEPNRIVYDFGQNFAGWPRVRVKGPAGAVLKLTPGELLKPDGSVTQTSSGGPIGGRIRCAGMLREKCGHRGLATTAFATWRRNGVARLQGARMRFRRAVLEMTGEELSSASPRWGALRVRTRC